MFIGENAKEHEKLYDELIMTERKMWACEADCKTMKYWWYRLKVRRLKKRLDKFMQGEHKRKKRKNNDRR